MDGESSYESDISESWSLIDINSNEESLSASGSPSESEINFEPSSEKLNSRETDNLESKDFVKNCKDLGKNDFDTLNGSDSNSSFVNEGFVNSNYEDLREVQPPRKSLEDNGKNDSDTESIEILDLDGNYRDSQSDHVDNAIDSHDSQTYQSDDEESLEERENFTNRCNSVTVIKRRKRRANKNNEEIENSVNSENRSTEQCDSKAFTRETNNENSSDAPNEGSNHPVYKHYRNNVANTTLSLSVGVIFAGVACLAIGHFLGVQDAAETAGELIQTLKKLQVENAAMESQLLHLNKGVQDAAETTGELTETLKKMKEENAALQSRLFHLNRALLSRDANSKLELPPKKVSCEEIRQTETSKTTETDLNQAALSEIRSSLNSIEWLSKLQNLVRNENKATESALDFKGLGLYLHDQLNYLKKEGGVKLLEDADRKISKVLQKIVTSLSSSQENIENLYHKLINFKDKVNDQINKINPDAPEVVGDVRQKFERKVPVTEYELQTMKWKSVTDVRKNQDRNHEGPILLYQFPQVEKYYKVEGRNLGSVAEEHSEKINSTAISKKYGFENFAKSGKKDKKRYRSEGEKKKHKKRFKENTVKDSEEGRVRKENKNKKQKRSVTYSSEKLIKENGKKKGKIFKAERVKITLGNNFNKTDSQSIFSKKNRKETKGKRKEKKMKKAKLKKPFLFKPKKDLFGKNKFSQFCSGHECFNSTGFWVFKWADGREEFRRYQTLGDWQFERAKRRKELRVEDDNYNWQFKRALGRESNRHVGH